MTKYGAKPIVIDGIRFPSLAEGRHYEELKLRVAAKEIGNLELQPKYPLVVNGVKVGTYIADFRYQGWQEVEGKPTWVTTVVDVKGMPTPVYKLKKKLVEALYGITITEVR